MLSQYSGVSQLPPLFTKVVLINSGGSSTSGMTLGSTNLEVNLLPTSSPRSLIPFPKLQALALPSCFHPHLE